MHRLQRRFVLLSAIGLPFLLFHLEGMAGGQESPGSVPQVSESSGSSSGSPGMPDEPALLERDVRLAAKGGKRSKEYIGSLITLGMYYNRNNQFVKATATLNEALRVIDSGALKPTPAENRTADKIIQQASKDTVSAQVVHKPLPYEETLQQLLPALATAQIGANRLAQAEATIKRLLKVTTTNPVADKVTLMSAYAQYSETLRKLGRNKEADEYLRKSQEISKSFIGL